MSANSPQLVVVHHTPGFVVIDKPSGLLSVPGIGAHKQDCAVARVRALFPQAVGTLMVHRLDMDTSGLLVVALTREAQRDLSAQFASRKVEKVYTALVDGQVALDAGAIDLPMRLDVANRPYQIIDFTQGRPAVTRYRVLSRETDRTRVRFEPETGRTHQIRVHAAAARMLTTPEGQEVPGGLSCPILGDILYGRQDSAPRLMLHAGELRFKDPRTGTWVEVRSPTPF